MFFPVARRFLRSATGVCLLLIVITAVTYLPVLKCDFVNFDDPKYVTENAAVAGGVSWNSIVYAWTTIDLGNWIPLTWLSLEVDAALYGINARAFHVMNVVWHALNVCLLYLVLYKMTGASGRSALVAILFGVHPLHVESVAWISERKDVLSTFFLLLALVLYERYAFRPTRFRLAGAGFAMALGLLAKPMLVTLPVLLLCLDIWPLSRWRSRDETPSLVGIYPQRTGWQLLAEKIPLCMLSIFDGLITIGAQRSGGAMQALDQLPPYLRLCFAIQGYGWYLWRTLCPARLSAYYPMQPLSMLYTSLSALFLIAISVYVFRNRERRYLLFGWLWFVLALLPVSGLMQAGGQAYADRYAYVPHIGLFVAGVWESQYWLSKWSGGRYLATAIAVGITGACMLLSGFQILVWRNSETLWLHALALDPDNYRAHENLGVLRQTQQDFESAERHLRRAVAIRPAWGLAITNLGWLHVQRQDWEQAEESFAWALRVDPKSVNARKGLAHVHALRPAAAPIRRVGRQPSAKAIASNRLGLKSARSGELKSALRHFQEALATDPEYSDAHNNAALTLSQLNRPAEAEQHFRLALKHDPDNRDFHVNLGALLESQQDWDGARQHYESALRLHPKDVEAQQLLDRVLKIIGGRESQ